MMSAKPVLFAMCGLSLNVVFCSQGIGEMLSLYVKATTGWQNKLTYVQAQGSMVLLRDLLGCWAMAPTYIRHELG
jgi:hypothetical protein